MTQVCAISVVLPTRNGAGTIREQLDALIAQEMADAWELIVVDNGSTDDTVAVVEATCRGRLTFRVVDASARTGLSYARNVGVAAAGAQLVAFCDDDDHVDPRWLSTLVAALRHHPFVASEMEYDQLNAAISSSARGTFQRRELGRLFGYPITNGAIGIRKSLWQAVGGNDETLNRTGEDFDLAIRVQIASGIEPCLATGAVYHYRQRTSLRSSFRQGFSYGYAIVMLYDRFGHGRVDRRAEVFATAKAWWWQLSRAPFLFSARRKLPWARKLGFRLGRLRGSIAYRHLYP